MADQPFTEEDVQRLAAHLAELPFYDTLLNDDDCGEIAHRALVALTADGRLLPGGGELRTQFGVLFVDGFRAKSFDRAEAAGWAFHAAPNVVSFDRRTVRLWPDGSSLRGPWEPVPATQSAAQSCNASTIDADEAIRIAAERGDPAGAPRRSSAAVPVTEEDPRDEQ